MYSRFINEIVDLLRKIQICRGDCTIDDLNAAFEEMVNLFRNARQNRNKCFFIGNGGSAAIAMHMTTDFMKNGGVRTVSLFDPSILTCLGNDFGYENVFSKSVEMIADENDLLVAISSSGNSTNIINAINIARQKKTKVITLSGFAADNGIRRLGDLNLYVPKNDYGMVESVHNMLLQQIVDELKNSI
ncbi:MAG: SIS domain-containing protein [Lachnospiraceae bacterium]|nr:SIS domain-containing protein [Lachnospiraceae bacterium]